MQPLPMVIDFTIGKDGRLRCVLCSPPVVRKFFFQERCRSDNSKIRGTIILAIAVIERLALALLAGILSERSLGGSMLHEG